MMSLFDEEQIMKAFIKSERHDEARETAERMIRKGNMRNFVVYRCIYTSEGRCFFRLPPSP